MSKPEMAVPRIMLIRRTLITILTIIFMSKGTYDLVMWITHINPFGEQFLAMAMVLCLMPLAGGILFCAYYSALAVTNMLTHRKA